jgi:hypothetical protein
MRSFESSRSALARILPCLLLGSLGTGCNARLDISDETASLDAGLGGSGGTGTIIGGPSVNVDAGTASCADGIRSGDETDIDCGGEACAACVTGASCERHDDCTSGTCLSSVCTAISCEDGIQNGDEAGIDCGGDCARCRTSTCNCASSPQLTPLECDETEGYLSRCGERGLLSADGETFAFAMCHVDSSMTSTTSYTHYVRRADGTKLNLGDAGALALSSDGQRLLVTLADSEWLALVGADGARTSVPLRYKSRMSGDGATIFSSVRTTLGAEALVRWTESGGVEMLGELPVPGSAELGGVSHEGTAAVGYGFAGARPVPFRWTVEGGIEDLGALPAGADGARPVAISADGSTIAGFTFAGSTEQDIFRWSAADQIQVMGPAVPLAAFAGAGTLLLSADGAVLAGSALVNGAISVVRWGTGGTAVPNGAQFVTDMTADGSTLVGVGEATGFLWSPPLVELTTPASAYDVTRLDTLLAQSGADSTGWALETITNISDDGRIVYGGGTCGGVPTYFRMQLSP